MRYCQSVQLGCTHWCKVRSSSKWHPCKAASMILILQVSLFLVGVGNVLCTLTMYLNGTPCLNNKLLTYLLTSMSLVCICTCI